MVDFSAALSQAVIAALERRWQDGTATHEQVERMNALKLATGDGAMLLVKHIHHNVQPPVPASDGRSDFEPFLRSCARWIRQDEDEFVASVVAELVERGIQVEYVPEPVP